MQATQTMRMVRVINDDHWNWVLLQVDVLDYLSMKIRHVV